MWRHIGCIGRPLTQIVGLKTGFGYSYHVVGFFGKPPKFIHTLAGSDTSRVPGWSSLEFGEGSVPGPAIGGGDARRGGSRSLSLMGTGLIPGMGCHLSLCTSGDK